MYVQVRQGFIEADAWDGAQLPLKAHQDALSRIGAGNAVVVRSRRRDTIAGLLKAAGVKARVWDSPKGWDYEFRCYLTKEQFAIVLATVALSLDYRNFKSWCKANDPKSYRMAHDLWDAAKADADRRADHKAPVLMPAWRLGGQA